MAEDDEGGRMSTVQEYAAMRAEGMSYMEIAARCGCSYQNVAQMLARRDMGKFRPFSKERCCYDGLRNWLNENQVCAMEIIRRRYGHNLNGSTKDSFRMKLNGQREIKKSDIDFFRELTGLTYEQLFCDQEEA